MPYRPSHNPVIARFDVNELPVGWYWFRKPDGKPHGPYETEADAVEAAREFMSKLTELDPSYRAIDEWLERQSFIL